MSVIQSSLKFFPIVLFQLCFLLLIIFNNYCEFSKESNSNTDNRKEHSALALNFLVISLNFLNILLLG